MPKYEVHIPSTQEGGMSLTFRVTADNWMSALKAGLKKLGEDGALVQNILCDIMDDQSVHVTDPKTNRVFRIKELEGAGAPVASSDLAPVRTEEDEREDKTDPALALPEYAQESPQTEAEPDAVTQIATSPLKPSDRMTEPNIPTPPIQLAEVVDEPQTEVPDRPASRAGAPANVRASAPTMPAALDPAMADTAPKGEPPPRIDSTRPATRQAPAVAPVSAAEPRHDRDSVPAAAQPRDVPVPGAAAVPSAKPRPRRVATKVEVVEQPAAPVTGPIGRATSPRPADPEEVLAELFERVQEAGAKPRQEALYFFLDLALEKIPAESGSVLVSKLGRPELEFAAARGPKAEDVLQLKQRVPMGKGIAGFCAQENVALAISDAQRDKRFFRQISEKVGYETHSMLCAPMTASGKTYGCVQIINRRGSSTFEDKDLAILNYVAHQAAQYLEQKAAP